MKRIILALFAGVALNAVPVSAEDAAPVVVGPTVTTPVVVTESATPTARRGILARLRDRRSTSATMTAPATTVTTPSTVIPVPSTTVPMPLPTVKPVSGTTTTTSGVITAGGMTPMMTEATTPTTRMGLMARLRARRG